MALAHQRVSCVVCRSACVGTTFGHSKTSSPPTDSARHSGAIASKRETTRSTSAASSVGGAGADRAGSGCWPCFRRHATSQSAARRSDRAMSAAWRASSSTQSSLASLLLALLARALPRADVALRSRDECARASCGASVDSIRKAQLSLDDVVHEVVRDVVIVSWRWIHRTRRLPCNSDDDCVAPDAGAPESDLHWVILRRPRWAATHVRQRPRRSAAIRAAQSRSRGQPPTIPSSNSHRSTRSGTSADYES